MISRKNWHIDEKAGEINLLVADDAMVSGDMARNGSPAERIAPADSIRAIAKDLVTGSDRKSAHLVNLSIASLKHLVLFAESDDIRFRAAEALLGLSPVRRKLDLLAGACTPPQARNGSADRPAILGQRLKRLMDSGAEQATQALALIEQAEKEAGLSPNPREPSPNPLTVKPDR